MRSVKDQVWNETKVRLKDRVFDRIGVEVWVQVLNRIWNKAKDHA